eukprot:10932637-Lingulodinium_polyedra.AAC.1
MPMQTGAGARATNCRAFAGGRGPSRGRNAAPQNRNATPLLDCYGTCVFQNPVNCSLVKHC